MYISVLIAIWFCFKYQIISFYCGLQPQPPLVARLRETGAKLSCILDKAAVAAATNLEDSKMLGGLKEELASLSRSLPQPPNM